jgi:hypothetical protein
MKSQTTSRGRPDEHQVVHLGLLCSYPSVRDHLEEQLHCLTREVHQICIPFDISHMIAKYVPLEVEAVWHSYTCGLACPMKRPGTRDCLVEFVVDCCPISFLCWGNKLLDVWPDIMQMDTYSCDFACVRHFTESHGSIRGYFDGFVASSNLVDRLQNFAQEMKCALCTRKRKLLKIKEDNR